MKRNLKWVLVAFLSVFALSILYSFFTEIKKPQSMSQDEIAYGFKVVETFQGGTFEEIRGLSNIELTEKKFSELQESTKQLLDGSLSSQSIGRVESKKATALLIEYKTKNQTYVLADVTIDSNTKKLLGFNLYPSYFSVEESNWNFSKQGPMHFIILLVGFCCLLVNCYLVYLVYKQPRSKLWGLCFFMSFWGVTAFRLNWTSGTFSYSLIQAIFLSFGVIKMPWFAPWEVIISLPLGGVLALYILKRKSSVQTDLASIAK